MNNFDARAEFEKEFKRLFKKYKTLDDDFEKFKKVLRATPTGIGKNFVIIHSSSSVKIVKARMACRALRDRSLRIIYAYHAAVSKEEALQLAKDRKFENVYSVNGSVGPYLRTKPNTAKKEQLEKTARGLIQSGYYNPNDPQLSKEKIGKTSRSHLYTYVVQPEHSIFFAAAKS